MKTTRPNRQIRRKGFTLLEMVIVLGIIAMILGGAIFAMKGIGNQAKITQTTADMKSLGSSLEMYKINAGNYPTTQEGLDALVHRPASARKWAQTMTAVPTDPWKNQYGYKFPGRKKPAEFEIISKGPDGIEGTEDDLSSQDD
ncbi:type II secretion system major pseudopilin GspG [Luteolibacter sp. LG18]|uniref:type II secretion system major pseudopilin GspG n=1 Tax=Luteolibacter sp. LG18 TaxID=2819286 RepID=UPI002B296CE4|nr:type II secretion system protein GspG [Luteolibacter sp. LG18]